MNIHLPTTTAAILFRQLMVSQNSVLMLKAFTAKARAQEIKEVFSRQLTGEKRYQLEIIEILESRNELEVIK